MSSAPSPSARLPAPAASSAAAPARHWPERLLTLFSIGAALLVALPVLAVIAALFQQSEGAWRHMLDTVLPAYVANTLALAALTGAGSFVLGVGAAWFVTMCDFPGRRVFEWALALPLALPAYVIAYGYAGLLDHPGPVQTALRAIFGWGPRDYWFPEIRSLGGAALVLTLVLYPYVYLLARSAFLQQSGAAFAVARTLGRGPWGAFFGVALPMARPAIATGVLLVLMETVADFGAVDHFGVQTFATGIYRAWFSMGDRVAAAQLSACLLVAVLLLTGLEQAQRRAARHHAGNPARGGQRFALRGWRAWAAWAMCVFPFFAGFLAPLAMLVEMSATGGHRMFGLRYFEYIWNSVSLAGIAAALTVAAALGLSYAARLAPSVWTRWANQLAAMGYAVPGGVIAVGLIIPLAAFDNALDSVARTQFGTPIGLLFTGGIAALLFAYMVRFMAVALRTVGAGFERITPAMDHAARALGASPQRVLTQVHAPLLRGSLATAALIVFVDVMKELPATLIMRPFGLETLASQTYRLAADERLAQASTPALTIVAVGLIPVFALSRRISRSNPASDAARNAVSSR